MTGRTVQTFRGPVPPEDLGPTLIHEHVFVGHPELDVDLPHPEWDEDVAIEAAVAGLERMWDLGVRAVIAPSFSDIFASNAFKNGIATVELDHAAVDSLLETARDHSIAVDLQQMTVTSGERDHFTFTMDPFRRDCLLAGLDEIALTLTHDEAITAYEHRMGI